MKSDQRQNIMSKSKTTSKLSPAQKKVLLMVNEALRKAKAWNQNTANSPYAIEDVDYAKNLIKKKNKSSEGEYKSNM